MRGGVLVVGGVLLLAGWGSAAAQEALPSGKGGEAPSSGEAAPAAPVPAATAGVDPQTPPPGTPVGVPDGGPPPGPRGPDLEAETEVTLDRGDGVLVGVAFSGPIGWGGGVRFLHGLAADVREEGTRVQALCALPIPHCAQGFLVQLDAGTGGGKVSLGLGARARVEDEGFRGTAGFSLRAALVRTWGHPIGTEAGLTYLGPELDLSVLKVDLTVGVLWRLGGQSGASALFSWGVGFGL